VSVKLLVSDFDSSGGYFKLLFAGFLNISLLQLLILLELVFPAVVAAPVIILSYFPFFY